MKHSKGQEKVPDLLEKGQETLDGWERQAAWFHALLFTTAAAAAAVILQGRPAVPEESNSQLKRRSSVLFTIILQAFQLKYGLRFTGQVYVFFSWRTAVATLPRQVHSSSTVLHPARCRINGLQGLLCILTTSCLQPRASELIIMSSALYYDNAKYLVIPLQAHQVFVTVQK